jgi:putative FmdB family regulatory protein
MPLYDYLCRDCGEFVASRKMAEASAAAPCPTCGQPGARILSPTATIGSTGRRRGSPEPRLVASTREPPTTRAPAASPIGRPWMLGH